MRPSVIFGAVVPLFFGCELMSLGYLQNGQASASPCAATHTFCDDFDHVDAASQEWNGGLVGPDGGATLVLDLDSAVDPPSPPGSLQVGSATGASSQAYLEQTFPGPIAIALGDVQTVQGPIELHFDNFWCDVSDD